MDPGTKPIRWGIAGTGMIAADMAQVLTQMPDVILAAVASRSPEKAAAFAERYKIPVAHGSYELLALDAAVDIVYVATPTFRHVEDSLLFLEAGKHVLCEKAMAPNATEAHRVLELARSRGLFFLHGVWSRFFPAMAALREVITSGAIGTVVSATCSFCQNDGAGACSATLETGIYCAQLLHWVFDAAPDQVRGVTYSLHENGNDQVKSLMPGSTEAVST